MNALFDIEPKVNKLRKETCNTCKYLTWVDYCSGKRFFYCKLRKSNRTENGLLKVKARQVACDGYVEAK